MDSLENNLKELIKESIREVLREDEFSLRAIPRESPPLKPASVTTRKLMVNSQEAAEMMSMSVQTVRRLISNGSLKASRKTRHLLIPVSELERIMKV